MKKTNQEVLVFLEKAKELINANPKKITVPFEKMKAALKRVKKSADVIAEKYYEQVEDLRLDHCSVDADGNIEKDQRGNLKFKKTEQKKLVKAIRRLSKEQVTLPVEFVEVPKELPYQYEEALTGFVFEPKKELAKV